MARFTIHRRSVVFFGASGAFSLLWGCDEKERRLGTPRRDGPLSSPPGSEPSSATDGATRAQGDGRSQKGEPDDPAEPPSSKTGGHTRVAVLAGGCFWGMEEILRDVPGVVDTQVGYAGGTTGSPSYDEVKTGKTGHAESVKVEFDPSRISYAELLESWFFRMHDPTTKNRQGNDVGTQYRSAIFYLDEEQKRVAQRVKKKMDASARFSDPIVTEVSPVRSFTPAENVHQDYLEKNPGGYTCHYLRDWDG